ncbi:SIMPL domain-containing protein [Hallella multisaccharivorax DSM 17128]|nr:SIMPL domain-containing protein [Hallella multisaccharivorax DSM 17128]
MWMFNNTDIMKDKLLSAAILAAGIIVMGLCLKAGMDNFTEKDRKVTVKGLAEKEVKADKVTWPILSKELGDDLPELYDRIAHKQQTIKHFLLANGISESEITVNAPKVIDLTAEQYSNNDHPYRYNVTLVITVNSSHVDRVRSLIMRQGELLKQGVAIVAADYDAPQVTYSLKSFKEMKPKMMTEAIENAEQTAQQFAKNSKSQLNKIVEADQGQFSIDDRDANTPWIKVVRVVTTVTYSLKN